MTKELFSENSQPAKTEPKASTTIGMAMVFGDSCGCGGWASPAAEPLMSGVGTQRFSPKKVISITRVM